MLKLKNINKTFNLNTINAVNVFTNLNLVVKRGSFVTIIGGNGAGKSTLLNLISGKFLPDNGHLLINDREITRLKEYQRAKWIGRVFQNPLLGTAPNLTVAENLALTINKGKPLNFKRAFQRKDLQTFQRLLQSFNLGLEAKLDLEVKFLSGGQRQALTLLMAVLTSPQLLLLDEHTAALDPKTAQQVMDLTHQLVTEKRLTTLMVTHNLEQAIKYGDRLLMFHQGQIILDLKDAEKAKLTTKKLLTHFQKTTQENMPNLFADRMLFS